MLVLVALSAKKAVLIADFAQAAQMRGKTRQEAVSEAIASRLRPIMMTSVALMAGLISLALVDGAGANAMQSAGDLVLGGLLAAATVGLMLTLLLYVVPSPRTAPPRG